MSDDKVWISKCQECGELYRGRGLYACACYRKPDQKPDERTLVPGSQSEPADPKAD